MGQPKLIGVLHLPALPGSPRAVGEARPCIARIEEQVAHEVQALRDAGFDGVILENFGDAPFLPGRAEPVTVAALTCVARVVARGGIPFGVNVLRNDVLSALAIAAVTGGSFVRVNVHAGAFVTDQGIVEGRAHETMRARKAWMAEQVRVWADVDVKHAAPLGPRPAAEQAHDVVSRGLADGVIVTGSATGAPVDTTVLRSVAESVHHIPVYVGSGAIPDDLPRLRSAGAHGVIVGSWIRENGRAGGIVDGARAKMFADVFHRVYSSGALTL